MAQTTMKQIANHLEFLGYQVKKIKKKTLRALHPTNYNFALFETEVGVLFLTRVRTNDLAKASRPDVLNCVNALNQNSTILRFYVDEDLILSVEAWYSGCYEKAAFGAFIDLLNSSMKILHNEEIGIKKYLQ